MALDQIAANLRQSIERADFRAVEPARPPLAEVSKEHRPGVFARPEENGVSMLGGLLRQGRDVQPAQANVRAPAAVMIGDLIRASRGSDVNLYDNQFRFVVQIKSFNMLVLQPDIVIIVQIPG